MNDDDMCWWKRGVNTHIGQPEATAALELLNEYLELGQHDVPNSEWERRVFELIENRRVC